MLLNTKIGGPVKYAKDKETTHLTNNQATHIYKKVELEGIVNIDTIKQVIEDKLSKDKIEEDEINPYHNIIIHNIDKENTVTSQMEQGLILSNVVNYMKYDRNSRNSYHLDIKTIDQKNHMRIYEILKEEERQILELDSGNTSDKLRREYLDMYEGVQSEVINTTRVDENSDLNMTYLGRTDMTRASKIKVEETVPISEQGYMIGKLLDGTECQICLHIGASKSLMFKLHYLRC